MGKQQILDELRRRNGTSQQGQSSLMDKQQILDYLRQRSSAQQQGTGTFAPVQQTTGDGGGNLSWMSQFYEELDKARRRNLSAAGIPEIPTQQNISSGQQYLPADYGTSATVSAGKTGWADYQAQQERYKNQPKQEPKEKSLLDTILEGIAGIGSDTTLPGVGGSQVLAMSKEAQANDPIMPRENWTDDERYAFGYLWNTQRQKAYDYARAVNNAYARQQEEKAAKEAADKASSGFWSGAANTAGAIVAAPLGLADTLKNLIDYGATGHMQEDGQLSPFEWSQAVTSGISQKLNEKGGTISESVPIIGGKGWGDVYSLGTSIVKSITAAYTGGAGQALITNFGPAVASATDSAKERGATDEQAMSYGFLSGLAEAAAEMVGVDNLLKLGAADSLKAVMKNLLKQGTTEALEEGLTSVVDNLADNLVLQDKSVLNQRIAAYTEQGMTPAQAKKQAWMDMAGDVIFDMLGGFVSGAASGGLETIVQTVPTIGRKPATTTQSEETAQGEKVPTQAEAPTQAMQTAQTPSRPMTPQQAMQEAIAEIIGVPSVTQAVESYRESGTVTNKQAEAIASDANAVQELLELAGIAPQPTKSKTRAAVKQAVAKLAQETVSDNAKIASESTGADATIAETVVPTDSAATARPEIRNDEAWEEYQQRLAEWEARQNQTGGFSSVGAANAGFSKPSPVDPLIEQYGEQETRPGDRRYVEIPNRDASGNPVSAFVGNAFGSYLTTDSFAETIQKLVLSGELSNLPQTNEQSLQDAAQTIVSDGIPQTLATLKSMAENGTTSPQAVAEGVLLYRFLLDTAEGQTGDARAKTEEMASGLFVSLKHLAASSGRSLQLFSLFRQLTPDGQVRAISEEIERYVGRMKRLNLLPQDYEIPSLSSENPLFQEFADASNAERKAATDADKKAARRRMAEAEEDIYKFIAAQIPATMQDKWDAWRHLSMLGNVKTQGRNFFGTAAFMPYRAAKQAIGSIIEKAIPQDQRTKAVVGLSKADRALLEWAKQDRDTPEVDRALRYTARLGESPAAAIIEDHRTIYTNKHLESVRKFVRKIPAKADLIFKRAEYASALAGFLKARGYTEQDILSAKIPETVLNEGRQYAVDEAMKATFNDCNALSDAAAKLRVPGEGTISKVGNILLQGAAPYRRTTANLAVRGVEYSPTGLINGLWESATKVKSGKITAAQAIDDISAGLTGSLAFALGVILSGGLFGLRIRGGNVPDEEKEAGAQPYSLEVSIGGETTSYRMDWIGPAALPLFMGANVRDAIKEAGEDMDASLFAKAVSVGWAYFEPVVDISVLSAIGDTLLDARYAPDGFEFPYVVANMATSYFTQGVPQLARQLVQAIPANERQTKVTGTDPVTRSAERMLGNFPVIGELFKTDKLDEEGNPIPRGSLPERLVDSFLSLGKTKEVDTAKVVVFDTVSGLKAEDGYSNVRPVQKYEAVAGSDKLTEEEKEAALKSMMDDKMEAKLEAVLSKGFDTQDFADSYRIYLDAKKKADAVKEIQNELGVNRAVATQIYEIYNPKPEKTK
jgi:hypothetical protein